jgi:hypothetical protein
MSKIDPFEALGNDVLLELAYDLQVQLERGTAKGMRPVLYLLVEQRKKAAVAIAKMIDVDVAETEALRSLQAEVRLYGDLVDSCKKLFNKGRDAEQQLIERDRSEMQEIVGRMAPEERNHLNLQQESID